MNIKKYQSFFSQYSFIVLVSTIFIGTAFVLLINGYYSRNRELNLGQNNLMVNSQILAGHAQVSLEKINVILWSIQTNYGAMRANGMKKKEIDILLTKLLETTPETENLNILDENGLLIYSDTNSTSSLFTDPHQESDYFLSIKNKIGKDLITSEPFYDPEKKYWIIRLARRLEYANGQFAGIVQTTITQDFFTRHYQQMKLSLKEKGLIAVTDREANILAHYPEIPGGLKKPRAGSKFIDALAQKQTSGIYERYFDEDGVYRIVAFQKVADYPFYTVIGADKNEILAEWKRSILSFVFTQFVLGITLALLIGMRVRNDALKLKRAEYKEYYDDLTKLPRFRLLEEHFYKGISTSGGENGRRAAFMLIDTNGLRKTNNLFGYEAGNYVLQTFALRLSQLCHLPNIICRYEGDSFLIFTTGLDTIKDISTFAETIISVTSVPIQWKTDKIIPSISIGISEYPNDGNEIKELIKNAAIALMEAKKEDGSNYRFYSQDMNKRISEHLWMETAMHKALQNSEFFLQYQPQFDIKTRELAGVEALIRWKHPERGLIPPDQFINISETSNLVVLIGKWVLKEACQQRKKWLDMGISAGVIAVNISAPQFNDPNFITDILDVLYQTELPPNYLELEITESVAVKNKQYVVHILTSLKKLGIRIAIDDFGTGYSSLSYLRLLPFDKIKIDKSFVQEITSNSETSAIVETILSLSEKLNLKCIAEGVETEAQLSILSECGCHEVQGFLCGRPVSVEEATNNMLENKWICSSNEK